MIVLIMMDGYGDGDGADDDDDNNDLIMPG